VTSLRGGTLNCKDGRSADLVAGVVADIVSTYRPHFLSLQESGHYLDALDVVDGYRIVAGSKTGGTALLVRNGVTARRPREDVLSGRKWVFRGHRKEPRAIASAVLSLSESGWQHRAVSFHGVPNLDAGFAQINRRSVYADYARHLVHWADERPGYALGIYGDFNATATDPREFRPKWIAREVDGLLHRLGHNDQAITRGCVITDDRPIELGNGFDHPLYLFTVRKARP
jgi:hypothetical protein